MKSLTGKFLSARGWAVLLILLLGAGLFVAACGDEEVPTPTTPAPTPPAPTPPAPEPEPEPEPEPAPEPPAVPVGLRISASGVDSITWTWNAVEGATGYVVQSNLDEMWDDTDTVMFGLLPFTTETTYTRTGLDPGTTVYARVAAAAGTAEAPLVSAFSTHVTGMTAEPEPEAPPAPANLRLKERGSDFIEWEWDEAPGADGYESQFSTDGISFVALQPHAGASNTSRRVSNLAAESAGHLQVRSYTGSGTGADTVRGDWSGSDRQTTDEPPAAVALDAPDDFESSDPDENSILLEWDDVDDADYYEVQQRVDGAGSWSDATCGEGGSGSTDDTSCVATGLDPETDYEFRVRAVPASDDDAHTASSWSETDATTADDTGPAVVMGSGDLNLIWSSDDARTITFTWDQISGAEYEQATATSASGCETATYAEPTAGALATFHPVTVGAGDAGSLCVRTKDKEHMSFVKGVAMPDMVPAAGAPSDDAMRDQTTAITWDISGITIKAGFDYDFRLAADPHRDNKITDMTMPKPVQAACTAGTQLDSGDSDIDINFGEISLDSGLQAYTGYLLCFRMMNDAGATDWVVPEDNADVVTLPARPNTPRIATSLTNVTDDVAAPVWSVSVRNDVDVPRKDDFYTVKSIKYPSRYDGDDTDDLKDDSVRSPTVATCDLSGNDQGDQEQWAIADIVANSISNDPDGIIIRVGNQNRPAGAITGTSPMPAEPTDRMQVCVRASVNMDGSRFGPWVLSSAYTIQVKAATTN